MVVVWSYFTGSVLLRIAFSSTCLIYTVIHGRIWNARGVSVGNHGGGSDEDARYGVQCCRGTSRLNSRRYCFFV